jgi:SpoIID/LytB domain protein
MASLREQHPELVAKASETTRQKLLRKEPARILPVSGETTKIPSIRVALAQHLSSLSFKISSSYVAKWMGPDGQEETKTLPPGIYRLFLKEPQEPLDPEITPLFLPSNGANSPATPHSAPKAPSAASDSSVPSASAASSPSAKAPPAAAFLHPTETSSTVLFFNLITEAGSFLASISDRSYRGSFQVVPTEDGFQLLNLVNLEEYLYSVLPSEIPASWPMEALKAQAIAARSYSLAMMAQSTDKPFDVYGTTRSASYRGVESEHPRSTEAVDATRGIYLSRGAKPLVAFYHANNGGYGEGTEAVWGYTDTLPPVPDPLTAERTEHLSLVQLTDWLRSAPPAFASLPGFHYPEAYRWERWVKPEEIRSRLGEEAPPGRITSILTRGRGISGRVKEVEIQTEGGSIRLKGDRVRIVLGGLRSTLFTIRVKVGNNGYPEYFIFNGGGWGHGVGLDQSGAAGMAAIGYTAEEILRHYYPNATLMNYLHSN